MYTTVLFTVGNLVALCGVFVVAYSAAKAMYLYFIGVLGERIDINGIRLELGYGIILAFEFFVAADIIESVGKPTYYDVGLLAALVLIRTFLSYFLNKELAGSARKKRRYCKFITIVCSDFQVRAAAFFLTYFFLWPNQL